MYLSYLRFGAWQIYLGHLNIFYMGDISSYIANTYRDLVPRIFVLGLSTRDFRPRTLVAHDNVTA
jgi:hypothetical protein